MTKLGWTGAALALCGFLGGCASQQASRTNGRLYRMGEAVQTGPLVYTVLDTEWLDQIGDPAAPRLPRNRFLSVRISVTNTGAATSGIPPLTITDGRGASYTEINDVSGLAEWLGYIRSVRDAETLHGRVLFDAPPGAYRLKVADDADPENQTFATIEMPLQLTRPQVRTEPAPSKYDK